MINKKKLIIILIVATALFAGFNVFLFIQNRNKSLPPQSVPQASLPPTANQPTLRYIFQGNLPNETKNLSVYAITAAAQLDQSQAQQLSQKFGFSKPLEPIEDITGTIYFLNQDNRSISIYPRPLLIEYRDNQSPYQVKLTQNQLLESANNFLSKINITNTTFSLNTPVFRPVKTPGGNEGLLDVPFEQAEFVEINYNIKLNNVPVISKERKDYPIRLLLDINGNVRKATITLIPKDIQSIGEAKLTKPGEALTAINSGLGTIATFDNPQQAYNEISNGLVSQAVLNSVEEVYIYDYDSLTLQPFYRFAGVATSQNRQKINIEVLITALPQEVYKNRSVK